MVVLIVLAPVLALTEETVRVTAAATMGESSEITKVQWSLRLDPSNAQAYHRLGMLSCAAALYLNPAEEIAPRDAISSLRKSVELSPAQPYYWSDLAAACHALEDDTCAAAAFRRALELSPMRPRLQWFAANYYLTTGNTDDAVMHFQRLLALDPSYAAASLRICLGTLGDPQAVLERVLPPGADVALKLAYVDALMEEGQPDAAFKAWNMAVTGDTHFSFRLAQSFLERLISLGYIVEAQAVWYELQKLSVVMPSDRDDGGNRIFNGDFERVPLNAGFDWRYQETPYLSIDFGDTSAYHGSRCLRLDFTVGRNEEYEPVYELIPVSPNQSYGLNAYVRSEGITSDSGPCLRVVDPACASCLSVSSVATVGTTPWHPLTLNFSAGPSTKLIRVSVWRPRGRTFPMEIAGHFWLDRVSLTAVSEIDGEASRK